MTNQTDKTSPEARADERQAFEAWATPHCFGYNLDKFPSGAYQSVVTQDAWMVWQAARAEQPAAPACGGLGVCPSCTAQPTERAGGEGGAVAEPKDD